MNAFTVVLVLVLLVFTALGVVIGYSLRGLVEERHEYAKEEASDGT